MFEILFFLCFVIGLIPIVILFLRKRILNFRHPVVPFVWLTLISSLYEYIVTELFEINAAYWFQFYSLSAFISILYFFLKTLKFKYIFLFRLSILFFIITYLSSFMFWDTDNFLISTAINNVYLTCIVILFTLLWVKEIFENIENKSPFENENMINLWESEIFYFVSGLFIYYCTTFFLFLSSNLILSSKLYFYDYWLVNILAVILLRLLLIISVWKMKKA